VIDLPIIVRPGNPETDINYVRSSWLRSYVESEFARSINHDLYFQKHTRLVNDLLSRCQVTVACDPEDETFIFGWMAFEPDPACIHYVNVKNKYRHYGVAKRLVTSVFPEFGTTFTTVSHYPTNVPPLVPPPSSRDFKRPLLKEEMTLKDRCRLHWKVTYDPYMMFPAYLGA
jgi:hypothetical protein